MLIDYNEFNLKLLSLNNFKGVILAEDHNAFGPFIKQVVDVYKPNKILTEHTAYASVQLPNRWNNDSVKEKLDEEYIPYTGYLDTFLNAVKDSDVSEIIGCDYNPGGENTSSKRLKFIRLVDKSSIKQSFIIREKHMENTFTSELNKVDGKVLMSIGGEHLRNKEMSGYPGISKIIEVYKDREDVLIVVFPRFK